MKESYRIILNTLATYGRSVFEVAVTLFSARWVLQALGQTDFGLYGVVGSIILLITSLRGSMMVGSSRFYAYSIGQGHLLSSKEANDDLQRWFNTSFSIHIVLPILLVFVCYPVGTYAIKNWLVIPPERVSACLWVFRISLITAFVNIFSIPFISMYQAHQLISELAFFDVVRAVLTFIGAYFLLYIDSDRLVVYALYMAAINAGIPLIQTGRAFFKFHACRVRPSYMYNRGYLQKLFSYVGWKSFGAGCVAMRIQGSPILINLFFGPQVNAAYNIANRVSIQATMLSSAMRGAFQPAITSMEGRGHREKMLSTALQVCKFGALLVLLFAIPLIIEMDVVLELWLKNPPKYAGPLCQWMLVMLVMDKMTSGQMLAVNAYGKIAVYELVQGALLFLTLPLSWLLFKLGYGPVLIGYSLTISMALYCAGRLLFCKRLLQLPIGSWAKKVALPVAVLTVCSVSVGVGLIRTFNAGFYRICLTTVGTGLCSMGFGWFLLLDKTERSFVRRTIGKIYRRAFVLRS